MVSNIFNTFDKARKRPHHYPYFCISQRHEEDSILQWHFEDWEIPNFFVPPTNYRELTDALENNVSAILDAREGTGCTALLNNLRNMYRDRLIVPINSSSLSASKWLDIPLRGNAIKFWLGKLILNELMNRGLFSMVQPSLVDDPNDKEGDTFWPWFGKIQEFVDFLKGSATDMWIFIDRPVMQQSHEFERWTELVKTLVALLDELHDHKLHFLVVCSDPDSSSKGLYVYQPIYDLQHFESILKNRIELVKRLFQIPVDTDVSTLARDYQDELRPAGRIRDMLGALRQDVQNTASIDVHFRGSSKIIEALQKFKKGYLRAIPRIVYAGNDIGGGIHIDGYILTALHVVTGNYRTYTPTIEQIKSRMRDLEIRFENEENYDCRVIYPRFDSSKYFIKPELDFALIKLLDREPDFRERKSMLIAEKPVVKPGTPLAIIHRGSQLPEEIGAAYKLLDQGNSIHHNISAMEGCSGDPIIAEDARVIALHCGGHEGGGFTALTLKPILDHLRESKTENKDVQDFLSIIRQRRR